MPRTGQDALDWCANQVDASSRNWQGLCLVFSRFAFDVAAKYVDASTAWENAGLTHSADSTPPAAVPVWWTGGSKGHGHVAVSMGGGSCYSSDILRAGKIDRVRIALISQKWGLRYQGWTEDINDVRVFTNAVLSTPAASEIYQLFLDGQDIADMPVIDGTSYCPVRNWADALGFSVEWNASDNRVSFDGETVDTPARMISDHAYLPIRVLVAAAGFRPLTVQGGRVDVITSAGG